MEGEFRGTWKRGRGGRYKRDRRTRDRGGRDTDKTMSHNTAREMRKRDNQNNEGGDRGKGRSYLLKIVGLNYGQHLVPEEVKDFIMQTTGLKINRVTINRFNSTAIISVFSAEDSNNLANATNIVYRGAQLNFEKMERGIGILSRGIDEGKLLAIMKERYVPESKYLDLSFFQRGSRGMTINFNNNRDVKTILKVVANNFDVRSLNLGENKIFKLTQFRDLAQMLPTVVNLSLENNRVQYESELDNLAGLELEEVIFRGNPFNKVIGQDYFRAITTRFPSVTLIDQEEVPTTKFVKAPEIVLPAARILGNDSESRQIEYISYNFVDRYITAFNETIEALRPFYNENSILSICISGPGSENYDFLSRNLNITTLVEKFTENIGFGVSVMTLLSQLPATRQDLTKTAGCDYVSIAGILHVCVEIPGAIRHADTHWLAAKFSHSFYLSVDSDSGVCLVRNQFSHIHIIGQKETKAGLIGEKTEDEKRAMVERLMYLTRSSSEECMELMERTGYDLVKAQEQHNQILARNVI